MNHNAARKITRANGGRIAYDTADHVFTVTRSDGHQSRVSKDVLTFLDAAEFKRRFLEVPK